MIIACLLALGVAAFGNAQDATVKTAQVQSFKAGGVAIAIPPPTTEMTEVGYDNREFMKVFVSPNNRLIAAFVLTNDLPKLIKGSDNFIMSKYAMVKVPRRGEYMDCGVSDFREVTDGAEKELGNIMNSSMKDVEEEINRRMKSLELNDATVSFGKPIQLGCLFSKQDAYGFGMVMPLSTGGTNMKMAVGDALMRVKQRLLFVYLYAEYKNENTVKWLRKATEDWADAILKANK